MGNEIKPFTYIFHDIKFATSEELTRAKWNYENCIEQNKIVQIERNNYSFLYFVKSYIKMT